MFCRYPLILTDGEDTGTAKLSTDTLCGLNVLSGSVIGRSSVWRNLYGPLTSRFMFKTGLSAVNNTHSRLEHFMDNIYRVYRTLLLHLTQQKHCTRNIITISFLKINSSYKINGSYEKLSWNNTNSEYYMFFKVNRSVKLEMFPIWSSESK